MRRSLAVLTLFAAVGTVAYKLPVQDTQDKVESIFAKIEEANNETALWDGCRELEELGRAAMAEVRKGLTRANPYVRIATARYLYVNEKKNEAVEVLCKVVAGKEAAPKKTAADLAASLVASDKDLKSADKTKIANELTAQARTSTDELAAISLWRAAWTLTETIEPRRALGEILDKADKPAVKKEAALALAEMGAFSRAKSVLRDLVKEPGERGRLARAYLKLAEVQDQYERDLAKNAGGSGGKYDYKVLDEIIDTLKANYHDTAKIVPEKLIEAAARGMGSSLDPYTAFYDEKMIKEMRDDLDGLYGGIGARVNMKKDKNGNAWLTIVEPIYSGPAYRAGLRAGDQIVEVEGESTVNRELDELVRRLRGKAKTNVTFKVFRREWQKYKEYTLQREEVHLETTVYRMMPGQIGYIKLLGFGEQDMDLVEEAIKDLNGKGMKALVFDLRGNPGGYLKTAVKLASFFLEKGQVVCTTRSQGQERDRRVSDGSKLTDCPLVVLVDGMSASASEILSGCLQDHKRAVLVGEKTFGKGSVQDLHPLKATDEKSAMKVTIAKWFLPLGRSVEKDVAKEGGVEPDIKAAPAEKDLWRLAESDRLLAGDDVDKYVKDNWEAHRELFKKLADSDGGDFSQYPKFDALYDSLKTKASKDDVREIVREVLRKRVQDDQGKPLYYDFQQDVVLQRGIIEVCKKANINAKGIKEYELFAKNNTGDNK